MIYFYYFWIIQCIDLLKDDYTTMRTAIVCLNAKEAEELNNFLILTKKTLLIHEKITTFDMRGWHFNLILNFIVVLTYYLISIYYWFNYVLKKIFFGNYILIRVFYSFTRKLDIMYMRSLSSIDMYWSSTIWP